MSIKRQLKPAGSGRSPKKISNHNIHNSSHAAPNLALNSPQSILQMQRLIGNSATIQLVRKQERQHIQREVPQGLPANPVADDKVDNANKTDEELASGIIDTQIAILEGWKTALDNFDKVLTSESDKATKPDFNGVLVDFLKDKLMGEVISRSKVPGAGDAFAILGKLEDEVKRAAKAKDSATLRDFYVQYNSAIGSLKQKAFSIKDDFKAKVRMTAANINTDEGADTYGMLRMHLVETLERLDFRLSISSPEMLFQDLSESWVRTANKRSWDGASSDGFMLIRLNEDFTIKDAELKVSGGQKIAEQLLRDSPNGVDVFGMKIARRVVYYKSGKSFPSAVVRLDEANNLKNGGSFAEGNYRQVYRLLMQQGLTPTKNLKGD